MRVRLGQRQQPSRLSQQPISKPGTVDTDVYHVVFSNEGAVVQSWTLKNYKDAKAMPLELVNQRGAMKEGFPLALQFRGQTDFAAE